jgi:tetratricopeptide (TPR) repeat protein
VQLRRQLVGILLTSSALAGPGVWAEPTGLASESEAAVAQTGDAPQAPATEAAVAPEQQAQSELDQGRELYKKGFTESAIVHYRRAIELNPQLVVAYEELGKILLDNQNQAYAITVYSKLAELQPERPQWKEILSDLYVAYDMPREAVKANEDLLAMRPDDQPLMRKLAQLYKKNGLTDEEAKMLARLAKTTDQAADYFRAGEALNAIGESQAASENFRLAVAKEPANLEYQDGLGKALIASNRTASAVDLYQDLVEKNPSAPGLKDRLGEATIALGDKLLTRQRYVAARKNFESAQGLLGDSPAASKLQERIQKAEKLNHVNVYNYIDTGRFADNYYVWMQNMVNIPMHEEDLAFQVFHDYRNCSSPGPLPAGGFDSVSTFGGGVRYRPTENYNLYAQAGSNQFFNVGADYEDDTLRGGVRVHRENWYLTSRAIRERYRFTGVNGYVDWQALSWLSLHGDIGHLSFPDGLNGLVYNFGAFFLPVNQPGNFVWGLGYSHGGVQYNRDGDPTLVFAPTNMQIDSFGTEIQHWLSPDFKYRLGYYYSLINNPVVLGPNGSTFVVGVDGQIGDGSFIKATYEYGNFVQGRINPGFIQGTNNYRYTGELQFTF